jgi:hypothetical protein
MPQYDPQRSRRRHSPPPDDEPAPVDALLEPPAPVVDRAGVDLPGGTRVEVDGGEVVVQTDDADVEISPRGDDIVVHTDRADVEVLPGSGEVIMSTAREDLYVDTASGLVDRSGLADTRSRRLALVAVLFAALVALVVVVRQRAGRHRG